jgi:dTDP-4-dehydrorhamnose reductase
VKAVILGARGQLGQEVCRAWPGEVIGLGRPEADLTRPESLAAALSAHRPDVVVNCAAYNFVDRAEDDPQAAFDVNAVGARALALRCRDLGCALMHFGTDYVFGLDEARRAAYAESDAPGPVNTYGVSKLAGEYHIRAICPRHFIIRTCGLYGRQGQGGKGGNFVEAILRRAAAGGPLRVVDDQECTPTVTTDLARAAAALAATDAYGLYHVTNSGSCTWFEMARTMLSLRGMQAPLEPISSAEYGAKARRPRFSVLSGAKYAGLALLPMRPWQEALREYLAAR